MKIALVQIDTAWADPQANRKRIEDLLSPIVAPDVILLPEMFSTGFATSPEGIAEADGGSVEWMKGLAARGDCAVAGSIATFEDGRYVNRFWFVEPDGTASFYDKHHLFGAEKKNYTPGSQRCVVEFRGVRFLLAVCYDLRFPGWLRCREDYDALLICASWPDTRRAAWDTLLKARAIENECYVAGVNRIGVDPGNEYTGGSALIDPFGAVAAVCPDSRESVVVAELLPQLVSDLRGRFPALKDADQYICINQ